MATAEADWSNPDSVIDYLVDYSRILAGAERAFDETRVRELVRRDVERARDFAAVQNHDLMSHGEGSPEPLSSITAPTLVIHGTADPMFPVAHGRRWRGRSPAPGCCASKGPATGSIEPTGSPSPARSSNTPVPPSNPGIDDRFRAHHRTCSPTISSWPRRGWSRRRRSPTRPRVSSRRGADDPDSGRRGRAGRQRENPPVCAGGFQVRPRGLEPPRAIRPTRPSPPGRGWRDRPPDAGSRSRSVIRPGGLRLLGQVEVGSGWAPGSTPGAHEGFGHASSFPPGVLTGPPALAGDSGRSTQRRRATRRGCAVRPCAIPSCRPPVVVGARSTC